MSKFFECSDALRITARLRTHTSRSATVKYSAARAGHHSEKKQGFPFSSILYVYILGELTENADIEKNKSYQMRTMRSLIKSASPTMVYQSVFSGSVSSFVLLLAFMTLLPGCLFAQRLAINQSQMTFTSNAELELITATSTRVQGLIDPVSNTFAFTVEMKTFQGFNSALQREHFNEKYMESEKYPRASFSGKIIEPIDFTTDRSYDVRAKGELEIHGQKQTRIIKATVRIDRGTVHVESRFFVPLSDHDISIPTIVSQKIATEIDVEFEATLSPQEL